MLRPLLKFSLLLPIVGLTWGDDATQLEPLTVTHSRVKSPGFAATDLTTISRADIEASNAVNLVSLLRSVSGVQIANPAGGAGPDEVFIRGAEPNFVVVLIDGVQVNDPTNTRGGSYDFGSLLLDQIERIEIVRGAASSVHGSDALGGVINITSRSGQTDEASSTLSAEIGGDDFFRGSANLSTAIGPGVLNLNAGHADEGERTVQSKYDATHLGVGYNAPVGNRWSIHATLRGQQSSASTLPEDSGGPRFAVFGDARSEERDSISGSFRFRGDVGANWTLNGTSAWFRVDEDYVSPAVPGGVRNGVPENGASSRFERRSQNLTATMDAASSQLALGVEVEHENGESIGFVDFGFRLPTNFGLRRTTKSAFAELAAAPVGGLEIKLGARHDRANTNDSKTSVNAGVSLELGNYAGISAYFAEGFKLPSFFALANPLVGNPSLRPETSRTLGLSGNLQLSEQWSLTARVYQSEFEDLIDFDPDAFTNVNRSEVEITGGELEVAWKPHASWRIDATLSHADIDVAGGGKLRRRPRWFGSLSVGYEPADNWTMGVFAYRQHSAFDSSIPGGPVTLPAWTRVDFRTQWSPNANLDLWFSIDNLLDENYEQAFGFPAAGIHPRLRIQRSW